MSAARVYEIMSIISGISLKALKMLGHIERLIICYILGGLEAGGERVVFIYKTKCIKNVLSLNPTPLTF